LIGKRVFDVQPSVASAEELRGYLAYLVAEQPEPTPYLTRSARRDGSPVDLQIDWTYKRDHDGRLLGFISVITDVTDRKRAEDQLRQAAVVFENTAEGVIITDADERIIAVNAAFGSLTGYSAAEVLGQESEFLRCGRRSLALHERVVAALREQGHWQGEVWYRRKSGELFPAWQTVSVVQDDDGKISRHVAVFSDISPIKRSQEQLDHLAHHDPLTDLPNRLLFNDRLAHAISRARRDDGQLAVVFIDIDRFKTINDSLGHPSGDEVLQQVARRLVASVRESDTVSRLGGDEFIILLEDLLDVDDVLVLATKLMQAFQEPFKVEGHSLHLNISMGISLFPRDGEEAAMLIKNADAAMYSVKDSGRNDFQFYTRELTHSVFERFTMENALRRAIDREELRLHFQAQLHLETGAVLGAEALLRWEHPELGLVPPAKFVPLAEDTGLIIPIGEWVLRTACRQLHEWRTQGIVLPRIAVNIAGPLISKGALIQAVDQALSESGLAADSLELEITESYIMHGTELSVASLQRMHDLGVGITIDDFGTGYSSLSYLKRLPVDALKIDRSFVGDIPGDPNDEAIVAAVIDLGRSLQLRVIAEGIETDAQRRFLMQRGCAIGQGFRLARPLGAEEFGLWLSEAVAFAVGSSGEGAG
jgi:diguanylate cyclase (GGDEF)-like protein/PAS domain S-box-containing protein